MDRNSVPQPAILSKPLSGGKTETQLAIEHYDPWSSKKQFSFKRYSEDEVKEALGRLFVGKCAYCESYFEHIEPMDVEHWRPKGAVQLANGDETKPGYYWLAATWSNLLPSCIDCNRRRRQEDATNPANEQSGKQNLFPVADETHRWTHHNQPNENGEVPLLLDPCRDDPDEYLTVDMEAVVAEKEPQGALRARRARASIDVFGLNRSSLVDRRKEHRSRILALFHDVKGLVTRLENDPSGPNAGLNRADLLSKLSDLKREQEPKSQYLLMKRAMIHAFTEEMKSRILALGPLV